MSLIEEELKIVNIKNLMIKSNELDSKILKIPSYQRPYRWSTKTANELFMDIYNAFKSDLSEYRLGSVILHKENDMYHIVDGQQRLTTLSILLYAISDSYTNKLSLLDEEYDDLSNASIINNYNILSKRVEELEKHEKIRLEEYVCERCKFVQIVTDNIQEAFQFFDSQNSRGKELEPHDLLKSYHLREMKYDDEQMKMNLIQQWEKLSQERLSVLFESYLYPIFQWQRDLDGIDYSSNTIDVFKGISNNDIFNYSIYHKASNVFIEQYNRNGNHELMSSAPLIKFQLTEPLIAGKRFFEYILYYENLLQEVQHKIDAFHNNNTQELPTNLKGDVYTKNLYEAVVLMFVDRFGEKELTPSILNLLYTWSYSIRLTMQAVSMRTINKYAKGKHDINQNLNLFQIIREMRKPDDLKILIFEKPNMIINDEKRRYQKVKKKVFKFNKWEDSNES